MLHVEGTRGLLLWDSVLPMYRRQGVGSMMVLSRMKGKEAGCEHMYYGEDSYYALVRSLGFKSFAKFNVNRFDCQANAGRLAKILLLRCKWW